MSNRPEDDPIAHAAKFMWLFALIPTIFGALSFFLPAQMTTGLTGWQLAMPFAVAALIALVGVGVWKRLVAAAWAGIVLFAMGLVGIGYAALAGESKGRSMVIVALLLLWPIKKLFDAMAAIRKEQGKTG